MRPRLSRHAAQRALGRHRRQGYVPRKPNAEPQPMDPEHMKVLSISRTPVAGVAILLPDYINRYSEHKARSCVRGTRYRDGRQWHRPDGLTEPFGCLPE